MHRAHSVLNSLANPTLTGAISYEPSRLLPNLGLFYVPSTYCFHLPNTNPYQHTYAHTCFLYDSKHDPRRTASRPTARVVWRLTIGRGPEKQGLSPITSHRCGIHNILLSCTHRPYAANQVFQPRLLHTNHQTETAFRSMKSTYCSQPRPQTCSHRYTPLHTRHPCA